MQVLSTFTTMKELHGMNSDVYSRTDTDQQFEFLLRISWDYSCSVIM